MSPGIKFSRCVVIWDLPDTVPKFKPIKTWDLNVFAQSRAKSLGCQVSGQVWLKSVSSLQLFPPINGVSVLHLPHNLHTTQTYKTLYRTLTSKPFRGKGNIPTVCAHICIVLQRSEFRPCLSISLKEPEMTSADSLIQTNPHTLQPTPTTQLKPLWKEGKLNLLQPYHNITLSFFLWHFYTHSHTRKAALKP